MGVLGQSDESQREQRKVAGGAGGEVVGKYWKLDSLGKLSIGKVQNYAELQSHEFRPVKEPRSKGTPSHN